MTDGELAFYSAAAQIIPLLLVVLAIDARLLRTFSFQLTLIFIPVVALGEGAALSSMLNETRFLVFDILIGTALLSEFLLIILAAVFILGPRADD